MSEIVETFSDTMPEDRAEEESSQKFALYILLIVLNAAGGILVFEWAWYRTRRYRNPLPGLEEAMPCYKRVDALKWKKWRFYLGAMTLLIPRYLLTMINLAFFTTLINLVLIGHDRTKPLENGCRKWCLRLIYKVGARILSYIIYFCPQRTEYISLEDVNHYEEWLGLKEEQEAERNKKAQENELKRQKVKVSIFY